MPWEDWFPKKFLPVEKRKDCKETKKEADGKKQTSISQFFVSKPPTNPKVKVVPKSDEA